MNFEPTADQALMSESFARFFDEHSSMRRVRAALPTGFDPAMWREFAALGGRDGPIGPTRRSNSLFGQRDVQ